MTMYRIQSQQPHLQQFRSTEFGLHYLEQNLEDWFEANPEALTDGEPLLIIGRQVSTGTGGALDLLGLDEDGATVIVEFKRAPTPRDVIAQALEYTAWVASLDDDDTKQLAENYLAHKDSGLSLGKVWNQAFGGGIEDTAETSLPADLCLNERQRIIVVIEGANDRVAGVARYLRSQGVDINLLEYRYYRIESGEEILDIEQRVGKEQFPPPPPPPQYTEERLLKIWGDEWRRVYTAFRDRLLKEGGVSIAPRKTSVSFYKQTRDGRVFVSSFYFTASQRALVSFSLYSLRDRLDIAAIPASIQRRAPPDTHIKTGKEWCSLHFPPSIERSVKIANIIAEEIVSKVE